MSIVFRRSALAAVTAAVLAATLGACTPLQVVTHTVTATEARVPAGQYKLDQHHTSVTFDVDHLKYTRFTMRFDRVAGQLDWNEGGLDKSQVTVTIDAASIDTNVALLDKMVKGPDMLDAERNPQIRFVSTRFERTGDARGKLTGDLTIRGVTQPVTLDVTFNGYGRDPLTKADTLGFSADGRFSRSKFGLTTWYPAVGDDIHVVIQAEAARPPAS
ncbi:YceI family protein [Paraburkholderia diazotrophica]|uniref:YceI family protein n=1 Tax=Paraburkholderia diazotrophica TaxID=667676 RepID=UPI003170DA78